MPGFPLMAFGAGLGRFAEQYAQQQEQRQRNAMTMLTLAKYQQELQELQDKRAGKAAEWELLRGGGGTGSGQGFLPLSPTLMPAPTGGGVGFPMASPPPAPARAPSYGATGEYGVGGIAPGMRELAQIAPQIRQAAPWSGTMTDAPPDALAAIEASGAPGTRPGWAPGGPVGSMNAAGIRDATMPTIPPRSAAGFGAPQQMAQGQPSGAQEPPAGGAPPDLQKMLDAVPKPDLRDQTNQAAIAAKIEQAYGNRIPPTQKLEIFNREIDRAKLAEADRAKLAMKDYDTRLQATLETWKEQNTRAGRALEGGDLVVVDGKLIRQKGGVAQPVMAGGQPVTGATRLPSPSETEAASKNIEITGPDGKEIFKGAAHKVPGAQPGQTSWIDDRTQERIIAPDGSEITVRGEGGEGKQAAAMLIRLTSAANEAKRQIPNISRASMGATTSWFQGIQSDTGKDLSEGVRRSLANKITPQEEQVMSVLGRGVGRSLASLETAGAATGLIALTQSMQANMPAKGDTKLVSLLKLAEMRQIAEQGIESAIAAPAVGSKQEALLRSVQEELHKAIPYSVADVLDLMLKPGKDTYQTFAAKLGLGQKGTRPGAAAAPGAPAGASVRPGAAAAYRVGETIDVGGKRYRVTRIDPAKPDDPEIEEVK